MEIFPWLKAPIVQIINKEQSIITSTCRAQYDMNQNYTVNSAKIFTQYLLRWCRWAASAAGCSPTILTSSRGTALSTKSSQLWFHSSWNEKVQIINTGAVTYTVFCYHLCKTHCKQVWKVQSGKAVLRSVWPGRLRRSLKELTQTKAIKCLQISGGLICGEAFLDSSVMALTGSRRFPFVSFNILPRRLFYQEVMPSLVSVFLR